MPCGIWKLPFLSLLLLIPIAATHGHASAVLQWVSSRPRPPLSLPDSLSLDLSLRLPDSLFLSKSLSLLGIKTDQWRYGLPELHRWTRAGGDELEDGEVDTASSILCETPSFVVEETCEYCAMVELECRSTFTFDGQSRCQQVPFNLLVVMVPFVRDESARSSAHFSMQNDETWQLIQAKLNLILR